MVALDNNTAAYVALMSDYDVPDIATLLDRPPWQLDAACREHPDVTWFPARGESSEPARRVCARCLVRAECVEYALTHVDTRGVWAGTSTRTRRLARKAKLSVAEVLAALDRR